MKTITTVSLAFFLCLFVTSSYGQLMENSQPKVLMASYTDFSAVLFNGEIIFKENTPAGPMEVDPIIGGVFSVAKVDRSSYKYEVKDPIGFKIAIHNHRTNALRMYSEDTLYEVSVDKLRAECEMGDKIIFITIDPKHQLPRHEIRLAFGC